MIVIASREGQFANRVIHFANIYAFCKAHSIRLWHLHFGDYLPYFPNIGSQKKVNVAPASGPGRWFGNLFILLIKVLIRLKIKNLGFLEIILYERYDQGAPVINLADPVIVSKAKRKILVLYGWLFRAPAEVKEEEKQIRNLFALPANSTEKAEALMSAMRKEHESIVGVHIRRGDYSWFENGRWYYDDDVYAEKMLMMQTQLRAQGKNPAFFICSNEKIDISSFTSVPVYYYQNDFLTDFLMLSMCDYIIGPPSTFSHFASYWGGKPLQHISYKATKVAPAESHVVRNLL